LIQFVAGRLALRIMSRERERVAENFFRRNAVAMLGRPQLKQVRFGADRGLQALWCHRISWPRADEMIE